MELIGHYRNGVVVFDGPTPFREGEPVIVRDHLPVKTGESRREALLPFVKSDTPARINLTSEMIHQLQEEEDLERFGRYFKAVE